MNKLPIIETKRLILREIRLEDCNDMFEYASLPYFGPMAGWQPHRSVKETKSIIELFHNKKKYGQLGTFAVILKEENKVNFDLSTLTLEALVEVYDNIKIFIDYLEESKIEIEEKGKEEE